MTKKAPKQPAASATPAPKLPPKTRRSAVTNGSRVLLDIDGLSPGSPLARRFGDIFAMIVTDVAAGETLSEGQLQLCRRAASLSLLGELIEARLAAGTASPDDIRALPQLSLALMRLLQSLGLKKPPRDVTPSGKQIDGHALAVLLAGGGQ